MSYEIIAEHFWQEVINYEEFWWYQWSWLLVSKKDDLVYVYKDYYGSCSGCDPLEANRTYDYDKWEYIIDDSFFDSYQPFATIDINDKDFKQKLTEAIYVNISYSIRADDAERFYNDTLLKLNIWK